jgi:hypothetical protein
VVPREVLIPLRIALLLAVTLPALLAGPAAGATEQERLTCLGRLRSDYGRCLRDAQAHCRQEFEERLGGCFGGPDCPGGCLATERECSKQPLLERDGCRLACQADGRVAVEVDREACRRTVRMKAAKCRAQCDRRVGPALGSCRDAFSDCLRACARKE